MERVYIIYLYYCNQNIKRRRVPAEEVDQEIEGNRTKEDIRLKIEIEECLVSFSVS